MDIKDEFEKLREQILTKMDLFEDKIKGSKPEPAKDWMPRVGEIVEMSDDGECWLLRRYDCETDFSFSDTFGESFEMRRPLNDPLVIQLIPHVPGNPRPSGDANNVIVVFENGGYDSSNPHDFNWDNDNEEGNIVGWFDIT